MYAPHQHIFVLQMYVLKCILIRLYPYVCTEIENAMTSRHRHT